MSNREFIWRADEKLRESYGYLKHECGLEVYVFPKRMTLKVALLGVKFGSVAESGSSVDGEIKNFPSGIAHFLEHKLFSSADGVDATEALAAVGADANAYTSNNKTVYTFSCTDNFEASLAELINFVYNPYFTEKNVKSERSIINQEINMCLDSPYDVVSQNLLLALYGDTKLSEDVLGTKKSIKKITPDLLGDCYESFYRYSNMALVVCGDVDADAVLDTLDRALPAREKKDQPIPAKQSYGKAAHKAYIYKKMPVSQPIFEIGIKDGLPDPDPRARLRRDVAMTILDEMLFSRAGELYNSLFEEGVINESYSYGYSITRDVAFHSIYAESDTPELVLERVREYVGKVKACGLDQKVFERCRRVMMAEFIRDFDSVDDIANSLLNIVFDGGDIFEYREIIENVTLDDVLYCLNDSFDDGSFALSVVGNK